MMVLYVFRFISIPYWVPSFCLSKTSVVENTFCLGTGKSTPRHQHSNSCGSLSTDLLGPVIVGQAISVDDYVPEKPPERPPKNPNLRTAFPDLYLEQRVPSPDLPPPSPPTVLDQEVIDNGDPLPPPPPECDSKWHDFNERYVDPPKNTLLIA